MRGVMTAFVNEDGTFPVDSDALNMAVGWRQDCLLEESPVSFRISSTVSERNERKSAHKSSGTENTARRLYLQNNLQITVSTKIVTTYWQVITAVKRINTVLQSTLQQIQLNVKKNSKLFTCHQQ